jgi:hypothetical protein
VQGFCALDRQEGPRMGDVDFDVKKAEPTLIQAELNFPKKPF